MLKVSVLGVINDAADAQESDRLISVLKVGTQRNSSAVKLDGKVSRSEWKDD
jgi:hypothetical protein